MVDMKNLRVEAQVLEHDLPLLKKGGEAWITIAAFPDKPVRGIIAAVLPLVDTVTRAGRVVIRINGDGTLRPGMYADVRLEANRLPDRILVPARAIIERDNRPLVFVAQGRPRRMGVRQRRAQQRTRHRDPRRQRQWPDPAQARRHGHHRRPDHVESSGADQADPEA